MLHGDCAREDRPGQKISHAKLPLNAGLGNSKRDSVISVPGYIYIDGFDHLCRDAMLLPELKDRLELRRNRSLYSRLHRRLRIDPLRPEDSAEYVRMRLTRAGCNREIFTSDAVALIHEAALGSMRDTDRLASAALREAARRKRKLVERDAVARVVETDAREAA